MRREYDFAKSERGKFYRKGARMTMPIYLDTALQEKLEPVARGQGKGIAEVVIDILNNQVALLAALTPSHRRDNKRVQPGRSTPRKKRSPPRG